MGERWNKLIRLFKRDKPTTLEEVVAAPEVEAPREEALPDAQSVPVVTLPPVPWGAGAEELLTWIENNDKIDSLFPALPDKDTPQDKPYFIGELGERTFLRVPTPSRDRIFGMENEYGTVGEAHNLPEFIVNGGRIYFDCHHIEYCTPECSNPLDAVIFARAGEIISQGYGAKLYKNNVDSEGHSFGAHENYFTYASPRQLGAIIPFLITRQIFAGSGWLHDEGFELSQKSHFLQCATGSSTTDGRAILCTKQENHAELGNWHRLHLICGDANMSEVAEFLKLGTTGLILNLAEDGKLPSLDYNYDWSVNDVRSLSRQTREWKMQGTRLSGIEVQRAYLKAAQCYAGKDAITDEILARWEHVLNVLEKDPMQLVGTLDWITKKALIDGYAKKNKLDLRDERLRNIDLQYHDLDRETSLFYRLQAQGKIERLVTNDLIQMAIHEPPQDTRAFYRGRVLQAVQAGNLSRVRVYWSNVGSVGMFNPFEFTLDDFCKHPNKNPYSGVDLSPKSEPGVFSLRRALNEKYQELALAYGKKLFELTGLNVKDFFVKFSIGQSFEGLTYLERALLVEQEGKVAPNPAYSVAEGEAILARAYYPDNGHYYHGGYTTEVPLGQRVKILRKGRSDYIVTKVKKSCGCCTVEWAVIPEELDFLETSLAPEFKKALESKDSYQACHDYLADFCRTAKQDLFSLVRMEHLLDGLQNHPAAYNSCLHQLQQAGIAIEDTQRAYAFLEQKLGGRA
jgi:proteasome accessory factor A